MCVRPFLGLYLGFERAVLFQGVHRSKVTATCQVPSDLRWTCWIQEAVVTGRAALPIPPSSPSVCNPARSADSRACKFGSPSAPRKPDGDPAHSGGLLRARGKRRYRAAPPRA